MVTAGTNAQSVFRLQLGIDGHDLIDVALGRWGGGLSDLTRFFRDYAAPKLYRDIQDNFASEGGSVGGWQPLSTAYAAWKQKHFPGRKILQRRGDLVASFNFDGTHPGPQGLFEVSRSAMVIGTRVRHGQYQQRPTVAGRPPQRRFLFFMRGASETFGRLLHAFAVDQAKAAGLRTRLAIRAASGDLPITGGPGGSTL